MNPEAEALLKTVLAKDPGELTQDEKDFLLARKMYVGKASREKFSEVFKEKKKAAPQPKVVTPVEDKVEEVKPDEEVVDDEEDEEIDDLL